MNPKESRYKFFTSEARPTEVSSDTLRTKAIPIPEAKIPKSKLARELNFTKNAYSCGVNNRTVNKSISKVKIFAKISKMNTTEKSLRNFDFKKLET